MSTKRNILAAALAAGIAFPVGAYAQQGGFDGGKWGGPRHERGEGRDWRGGPGGPGGWRHHGPRRDGGRMLWNVAEKLSAAEVALGITAEQEPAWRSFTSAVVAFVQSGRGDMTPPPPPGDEDDGPDAAAPDAGPTDEAGAPPPPPEAADEADDQADSGAANLEQSRGVQRMERFLDRSIARGQAAERVKTALDGLSAVLTPEQAKTADRLLAELGPRHGPRHGPGRDGWGGPKGPRGPEGRGPGNRGGETPPPPAPPPAGEAPAPAQPQ